MNKRRIARMVMEWLPLGRETEWLEFKHNNTDPEKIGEYLSALSNAAALSGSSYGFIVWGIDDNSNTIIGTNFKPHFSKVGAENLENWLSRLLTPRLDFQIYEIEIESKPLVVFEIPAATNMPTRFKATEYIRSGSYKKPLKDFPEKERKLWSLFQNTRFEEGIAQEDIEESEVLDWLDYPSYFDLTAQPLPSGRDIILSRLADDQVIVARRSGSYDITNFGAILLAKDLGQFRRLARKGLRVVIYQGRNRISTLREKPGRKGYAVGFTEAISYINSQLPTNEHIGQALRVETPMYPEIAIRELVANALIHQDFSISGTGPMVEIFSDRIEITNPGLPLLDPLRFIDQPPRSRNEPLAAFMRRVNICEERGSGIDKVIDAVELFQLPPPSFRVSGENLIATLYAPKSFAEMDASDRVRACYQHACLCYVSHIRMTNTTLRKRFAIEDKNYPTASKIIADTIKEGLVKAFDPENSSRRNTSYVPFWAA